MRLTVLLYDLLVSRVLIYCKVVKWGLQFSNILSEIFCLQVKAPHYSGVLSQSFIFTWTAVTNNAFDICKNASYCYARKYELLWLLWWLPQTESLLAGNMKGNFTGWNKIKWKRNLSFRILKRPERAKGCTLWLWIKVDFQWRVFGYAR